MPARVRLLKRFYDKTVARVGFCLGADSVVEIMLARCGYMQTYL